MKHIQIVCCPLPDVCPNSGFLPIISIILSVGICCSFHLNTSIPCGLRTRIHSSKPCFISSSHVGNSRPYFLASQDDLPRCSRCGGSKRTRWNVSFSNGMSRKSPTTSGLTVNVRPSQRVSVSFRMSMNTTSGLSLSNQHIRLPQQASSILFILVSKFRKVNNREGL